MALPDLSGRTAVVTGASRGIGAALAREFAARGMRLGLCARGESVLAAGADVVTARFDVSDETAFETFTADVAARFGVIDLWINNAGVLEPIAPLRDIALADFRHHIDVNLTGVFLGSRCYVRHVRGHDRGGVLINVSSGAAWHGYAGWSPYCAGKAGVERLTDCIALEEEGSGLRAHSLAPGVVDTDMQKLIRACDAQRFPTVERFRDMKRSGSFNSGAFVARELLAIAFDPARRSQEIAIRLPDERG